MHETYFEPTRATIVCVKSVTRGGRREEGGGRREEGGGRREEGGGRREEEQ